MNDKPLTVALGAACVVHLLLLVMAVRSHGPSAPPSAAVAAVAAVDESFVELDVAWRDAVRSPIAPARPSEAVPAPARASVAASAAGAHLGTRPLDDGAPSHDGEAVVEAAEGAASARSDGWSFNPVAPDLRLPSAGRGVASERPASPASNRTYGVAEALDERDRDLGLSRGGPLLAATEEAARESGPTEGRAVFGLTIDRNHDVVVSLERADENIEAWRAIIALAKAKALSKSVRIPPTARGIYVQIELDASVVWPDGQKAKDTKKPIETSANGVTVEDDAQGGTLTTPQAAVRAPGKVCSSTLRTPGARIGHGRIELLDPVVGTCSLENAGSTGQRVVHGRIVKETRL